MTDPSPILDLRSVRAGDLRDVTRSLSAGELGLVRFDPAVGHGLLADVATGLVPADHGTVRFRGDEWSPARPSRAAAARGRIGRYFATCGWVYHLDVDENVTLRERHHTRRPAAEIAAEADRLARAVGLPHGLPAGRPAMVADADLQRAACVRMLLGGPPLIVFDEPGGGLPAALAEAVAAQLRDVRSRGSAVLWLTADHRVWHGHDLDPTWRWDRTGRRCPGLAPAGAED